jgi:DNA-binding response OmpR family regulator
MADLPRRTLREEGHHVIVASHGREGFEIARCSPFDGIILDVMLPGMDGVTVARQLRESRNQAPMPMLTGR